MMRVEVLGFSECPNVEPTIAKIRETAAALGIRADIVVRFLREAEDAESLRFFGSPTVRVNGVDIEPSARTRSDFAFGCRVYDGSGTPSPAMIRAALIEAGSI